MDETKGAHNLNRTQRAALTPTRSAREKNNLPAGLSSLKTGQRRNQNHGYESSRPDIHNPPPAGIHTTENGRIINASLVDHVQGLIKAPAPEFPVKDHHTTYVQKHSKPGYPYRQPEPAQPEPLIKPAASQDIHPGGKRHPFEVKKEPLHEKAQTMLTVKVPENVDSGVMKRELAKKGFHVVKSHFEHNTITNERTGKGFLQVRAPNNRYHQELQHEIKSIGLKYTLTDKGPNANMFQTEQ